MYHVGLSKMSILERLLYALINGSSRDLNVSPVMKARISKLNTNYNVVSLADK